MWAAPAAISLCLRFSADLVKAAVVTLIFGAVLSATEQHADLGALVCDMEPETITASDPGILENLKLCPVLTEAQQDAINAVLLGGGTVYGDPSSWDLRTLQNLGPLVLALNQTTLSLVAEAVREAFGRSIAATYSTQGRSQREKSLTLLRAFAAASASSHPRLKRSADSEKYHLPDVPSLPTDCLSRPVTASTISDSLLVLDYSTSEQLDLCLSNEVLKANLKPLLDQPLPKEYLQVMKKKLEQIYPSGIPEDQLKLLGPLSRQYTAEEISQWQVTSNDTLLALLNPSDGKWKAPQVQQLIARYQALGGTLTGSLLRELGGRNLCNLQEEQIEDIPPEAIRTAGQLDISSCSQTKKDQLYRKAQEAFAGQAGTTRAYYCQIWPYLGGAPAKDLKDLAKAGVAIDMDIDTFLALNPDELQKLSVMDVKSLLGENLRYLKEAENETSVMRWVKRQSQQELDCVLGIDLQGGMGEPSPTATPPHPTTSASITPTATVSVPTTFPTVPTPTAISSLPSTNSSTIPNKAPTPSAISPTPPHNTPPQTSTTAPSSAGSPPATSTTQPAPTTIVLCSTHQSATPNKVTPPAATLLTTILATVNPNTTSPSSVPPPAVTHGATTTSVVTNPTLTTRNTSTPLVSMNPPAPGVTINPAPATRNTSTPLVSTNPPAPGGTINPASPPAATLLTTILATVNPNTTSPSSVPPPALTHGATTTSVVTNPTLTTRNTSTPLVSMNPPAPGVTINPAPATRNTTTPSIHSAPSTLVPKSTSAPATTTTTEMTLPPHKPSPTPNSSVSTQETVVSSTAKTTTLACKTSAPPAFLGSSSTTTSSETTKNPPAGVPEPPRPTPGGYINLQPEAGSGSRLSSCLVLVLTTASLLRGLL
ncbi:PREDICTED: LOW QUALITY PROTEIN: mesothelin-like protein [Calidris pugnax]|uniref:LOW QUALITY PROTEIN: mesothelin-like protein n=1 Tax=Calidris pugnax TaxID=198806 RepID=UPI00071CA00D|nr:PREDICTED: LOW QUALITY PROTEIN: mesothelin-like protein [Calidris pugnax]